MKRKIKIVVSICFILLLYLCLFTSAPFVIISILIAIPVAFYILVPESSYWSLLSYDSDTMNASNLKQKLGTLNSSNQELNKLIEKAANMVNQYIELEKCLDVVCISCESRFANNQYIQVMEDTREAFNISLNKFYSRMDIVLAHGKYDKRDLMFFSQELVRADSQLNKISSFLKEIVDGRQEKEYVIVDDYTNSLKNLNNKY
ncbi:MAG: hypothetical protein ACI4F4_04605 [Lachnospiraceae bacterium]